MTNWIVYAITCHYQYQFHTCYYLCAPGPLAAANASSPIKKSKSSVPRFIERCPPGPAPPVRYEGLLATAGRPDPEPAPAAAAPFVAMAVGKTKEGESLPAKPVIEASLATRLSSRQKRTNQALNNRYRYRRSISNCINR